MIRLTLTSNSVVPDRPLHGRLDLEIGCLSFTKVNPAHDMRWKKRYKTTLTSWLLNIGY